MGMPLEQYYTQIIEPIMGELKGGYDVPHRGFSAVHAVDSLAAHIYLEMLNADRDVFAELGFEAPNSPSDISFRNCLADQNSAFQLIRDAAKANKHAKLTQGNPRVNGSQDTSIQSIAYGQGAYGVGKYGGVKQLVITELSGEVHPLETTVEEALDFLTFHAKKLNLI